MRPCIELHVIYLGGQKAMRMIECCHGLFVQVNNTTSAWTNI